MLTPSILLEAFGVTLIIIPFTEEEAKAPAMKSLAQGQNLNLAVCIDTASKLRWVSGATPPGGEIPNFWRNSFPPSHNPLVTSQAGRGSGTSLIYPWLL